MKENHPSFRRAKRSNSDLIAQLLHSIFVPSQFFLSFPFDCWSSNVRTLTRDLRTYSWLGKLVFQHRFSPRMWRVVEWELFPPIIILLPFLRGFRRAMKGERLQMMIKALRFLRQKPLQSVIWRFARMALSPVPFWEEVVNDSGNFVLSRPRRQEKEPLSSWNCTHHSFSETSRKKIFVCRVACFFLKLYIHPSNEFISWCFERTFDVPFRQIGLQLSWSIS